MKKLVWDFIKLIIVSLLGAAVSIYEMVWIANYDPSNIFMHIAFYASFLFWSYMTAMLTVEVFSLKDDE